MEVHEASHCRAAGYRRKLTDGGNTGDVTCDLNEYKLLAD